MRGEAVNGRRRNERGQRYTCEAEPCDEIARRPCKNQQGKDARRGSRVGSPKEMLAMRSAKAQRKRSSELGR